MQIHQKQATKSSTFPFDEAVCAILREAHAKIHRTYPEVRSLSSVVDYYGNLNDAVVQKGVWTAASGGVTTPDGVIGSLFQTLRMLENQFERLISMIGNARKELQRLLTEQLQLRKSNERVDSVDSKQTEARSSLSSEKAT